MSDPNPTPRADLARRFKRIARLLALFSLAIAALAVVLVASGDDGVHVHMMIATALGVGLMVFVGTALMSLVFLSSSSGHDEEAGRNRRQDDRP